ncbi:3-dehydroquinate synthase, partial [Erysipelatoclostridium ramosum]|nr:3-dehydroquinate synthase [Thomasclavelia ramosa]
GIDFIQIPTTTLSQIDSSIGGKVAINLDEVKNIVGAFYQPKMVFIDPDTLQTLPRRHYINGLIEALKAG